MQSLELEAWEPFDLDATLGCGQVFRWENTGGTWTGIVGDRLIRVRQAGRCLFFEGADEAFIRHYFAIDHDLAGILESIDRDPVINQAIEGCRGLRIIRQPPWECLASYIIATFTNIPSIKRRIGLLCREFGEVNFDEGVPYYSFPGPDRIAGSEECRLRSCSLGYRAPYICRVSNAVRLDRGWADEIRELPFNYARKRLMEFPGVGRKVADCVLLFGFERLEAVPVDVWIERIFREYYLDPGTKVGYERIRQYAQEYFGPYAGYAQEYLFWARESLAKKGRAGPK